MPVIDQLHRARQGSWRRLHGSPPVARVRPASRRAVRVLRPFRPGHHATGRQPRRAPASAHRPRDRHLPVRRRDDASGHVGLGAAHRAGRDQLDDGGPRHRPFRTRAGRSARHDARRARPAALGSAAEGLRGIGARLQAHAGGSHSRRHAAGHHDPRSDRRGIRRAISGRDVRADALSRRRTGSGSRAAARRRRERRSSARSTASTIRWSSTAPKFLRSRWPCWHPASHATIVAPRGARCVVVGGEPLDGPRFIWWNFVSSSKERIERAKEDWSAQRMGQIAGEHEWIPLP